MSVQITSMSSRGQIVIPQNLRNKMKIQEGEKFVIIGDKDMILLKKLEMPSFEGMDTLIEKTREFVKNKKITEKDVKKAIKNTRK